MLQICIDSGSDGATGITFVRLLREVLSRTPSPWVVISDIDIAGPVRPRLAIDAREARALGTDEFLLDLEQATQIVWATAFFCESKAIAQALVPWDDYPEALASARFLARVVDATYYYFYGPPVVLQALADRHPEAALKLGSADELDYPE